MDRDLVQHEVAQYRGPRSCTGPEQPLLLKSNCCHTSVSSIRWPRVRPGSDEAHVREERARVAPLRGHAPIIVLLHPAEARQAGLGVQGDIGWRRESRGPTRTQGSRDEHTSALSGKFLHSAHRCGQGASARGNHAAFQPSGCTQMAPAARARVAEDRAAPEGAGAPAAEPAPAARASAV